MDGGPAKDGIPALTNPSLVTPTDGGAGYLLDRDRVIGLVVDGEAIAVPLNIGWWHEVINFDIGSHRLSVTHCPLTGSSLIFDRSAAGGAQFGVSGLLYQNNLVMYDRSAQESLWPQMLRGARCGVRDGVALAMYPALEMNWAGWKALHPTTVVVSSATGNPRNYRSYPYGDYDQPDNPTLLFPMGTLDPRRPPKERVLGLPGQAGGGIGLPFGTLNKQGAVAAVELTLDNQALVVFWDQAKDGAMAFRKVLGAQTLSFGVEGSDIIDRETGSRWRVDGLAVAGPLAGSRLEPLVEAFVAYWFAWAAFYPGAVLWTGDGP